VLFGLPVSEDGAALFRACTGRQTLPEGGFDEAWLICGRRAGKSFILALIAVYLVIFKHWRKYLSPGETGAVKILAVGARRVFDPIRGRARAGDGPPVVLSFGRGRDRRDHEKRGRLHQSAAANPAVRRRLRFLARQCSLAGAAQRASRPRPRIAQGDRSTLVWVPSPDQRSQKQSPFDGPAKVPSGVWLELKVA